MHLNVLHFAGHLTRDPERRNTGDHTKTIVNFGVATNRRWKNAKSEIQEEVTFIDVTAFDKQAELIHTHLKKGSPIYLEGSLQTNTWTDEKGQKQSRLTVRLKQFQFVGKATQSDEEPDDSREAENS